MTKGASVLFVIKIGDMSMIQKQIFWETGSNGGESGHTICKIGVQLLPPLSKKNKLKSRRICRFRASQTHI